MTSKDLDHDKTLEVAEQAVDDLSYGLISIKANGDAKAVIRSHGLCPFCYKPIQTSDFRDILSIKEYTISGLCQKCQDEFFKK